MPKPYHWKHQALVEKSLKYNINTLENAQSQRTYFRWNKSRLCDFMSLVFKSEYVLVIYKEPAALIEAHALQSYFTVEGKYWADVIWWR